jgi:hypothetical protein
MVVMAHGLLNSVAVIRNAAELVVRRGDYDEVTTELLGTIVDQAVVVAESLKDMIRGAPAALLDALDELDRHGATPDAADGTASRSRSNGSRHAAPVPGTTG